MNKCLNCSKETKNKKFCSSSCAAIFNNNLRFKKKKEVDDPDSLKTCNICFLIKKKSEFYPRNGCCKICLCKKKRENPKIKIFSKRYREKNREHTKLYQKSYSTSLKMKFLEIYGNKCSCCGENEYEFLTLDHVISRTSENRGETGNRGYLKAISEYRPDLYQTLCYNCNCGRRHGVCPHKRVTN
jgi:hypothetical protein